MPASWMTLKGDMLFAESDLNDFSFHEKLEIIMDNIKEFGEIGIFGIITKWKITNAMRAKANVDVTALYRKYKKHTKELDDEQFNEIADLLVDREKDSEELQYEEEDEIYRLVIARFLQMCLCHESYMMSRNSEVDISRLGLLKMDRESALETVYAMCRVHETGGATYIGVDPNLLGQGDDGAALELMLLTEEEAMRKIANCTVVVSPPIKDHKTIYYLDPSYVIPESLPSTYQVYPPLKR